MHFKQVTACHSAFDAESPKRNHLLIRGLRIKPAMTKWRNLSVVNKHLKNKTLCNAILLLYVRL